MSFLLDFLSLAILQSFHFFLLMTNNTLNLFLAKKKKQNAKQKQNKKSRTKIEICFPNVCRVSSHAQNDNELHFFPSSWKIKMKTKRRTK